MARFEQYSSGNRFSSYASSGNRFSSFSGASTRKTYDTSTLDKLLAVAREQGAKTEQAKPKTSLLTKTLDLISRPLYASAGTAKALIKGENVLNELKKGITGQEKETYSDVLGEMGVGNKYLKGGLGFALDVALDPSTYFGGTVIKGAGKVLSPAAKSTLNIVKKTLPSETVNSLELAGTSLKDAFGYAFKEGYKTTSGVSREVGTYLNKLGIQKEGIVNDMADTFKKLPEEQHTQFADTLLTHRKQIKTLEEAIKKKTVNPLLQEAKKYKSAEEFAKSRGEQVFRASDKPFDPKLMSSDGLYVSPSKNIANTFSEGGKRGIDELYVSNDAKILTYDKLPAEFKDKNMSWDESAEKIAEYAKKNGYDVIDSLPPNVDYPRGIERQIINPDVIKTKSQLTDIWNEANKTVDSRELAKQELNKMTPKFATQEQQDFFEKEYKSVIDKMADDAGLPADKRFEAYFPSISTKKLELGKNGTPTMGKVSDEGYKKLYKGVNEDELNKPIEALSRQSYKIVYDNTTRETMSNLISTYGKPKDFFKTSDEALEAGYMAVKDKKFGKEIGYLKKDDYNYINNRMFPEFKTLDIMAKASGFDYATRAYKTMLTAYFPSFHVRNVVSGTFQNYETIGKEAFNPLNFNLGLGTIKGVDKKVLLNGKEYETKAIMSAIKERFGISSASISDIGNYVEELTTNNFSVKNISKARQIGNFIETWQKSTMVYAALRKGKTLDEALDLAEKAGFDYSKITPFESKVMKRMIPFYTFSRKNVDLQLSTIKNNPERILTQVKMADMMGNIFGGDFTEEDMKGLPEWALSGLGFKVSEGKYLTQFGLPIEEFLNTLDKPSSKALSSMNPLIKYPAESKLGYDFFREQDIKDIRTIAPVTAKMIESEDSPQWLKDIFNVREYQVEDGTTRYSASPEALHVLRSLPTARLQSTLEKVYNGDMNDVEKATSVLTGAKIYDIDIELQKYFNDRDLRRDLEDELLMQGIGNEYSSFYIYK